jgi:hypothetical protein
MAWCLVKAQGQLYLTLPLPPGQEIPRLLWNPKAYYRVHESLPLVPNLSQMNPIHAIPSSYFSKIYFIITQLPNDPVPTGPPIKILYSFLIASMRATCLTYITLFDLITLVEEEKMDDISVDGR